MTDELIAVVPYYREWPRRFEVELRYWSVCSPHGSRAHPPHRRHFHSGPAAEPIIDMIAGVRDFEEARAAFEPLREQSYVHTPHWRSLVRRQGLSRKQAVDAMLPLVASV